MGVSEKHATLDLPAAPADLQMQLDDARAVAWSEPMVIPTYEPDEPGRFPMFLERRVYQGSSGRVYPLPFTDRIATEATPHTWQAIHLENQYLRLVVLPELGGRIFIGFDKTAGYDFFYRNNVIKPALVGLAGPWISGGVEFNWPQHHRPGTYLPVETKIVQEDDGSVTVWCSDHDPLTRMKGAHGIRLHPDRAVVELTVRLHNRTSETQTFLWWANVAVRVHDQYQSFFPTDVRYVVDHARRAMTAFPAADRPYYGVDYPARNAQNSGANRIDFYRNIPAPTSYMVVGSRENFFGGYDHRAGAGFVHWADHRIAPGKKQWTWGDSPFGHAWDKLLTDHDGPYVELMAGVYTDNQPDFSFLLPGETKTFSQYWYPIHGIGVAHQANLQAAIHMQLAADATAAVDEVDEVGSDARYAAGAQRLTVGVSVTARRPGATVRVENVTDGTVVAKWTRDLAPGKPLVERVGVPDGVGETDLRLAVLHGAVQLISWQPRASGARSCDAADSDVAAADDEPTVATEPALPEAIASVDKLYLTGLHLAQYRHPTRSPLPYWEEALRHDPGDARVNLALADHHYRCADYALAERHARASIARLTLRNGNPSDTEAFYILGLILRRLDRVDEAYDVFAKATWDGKWAHAASFECARLDALAGRLDDALARLMDASRTDTDDLRVRALHVMLLRRTDRFADADRLLVETMRLDPLDQLTRVLSGEPMSTDARTLLDVGQDLAEMGAIDLALALFTAAAGTSRTSSGNQTPTAHYRLARLLDRSGRHGEARAARAAARASDDRLAFPSGLDDHDALHAALDADPKDDRAHALLGTLLYDRGRHAEGLRHWCMAIELGSRDPVTFRNAGIAAYNHAFDDDAAWRYYEAALQLAPDDARLWYESDQLAKHLGHAAAARLVRLEQVRDVGLVRDDLTVEFSELLVEAGRARDAVELLESRQFQPWEGGEGRTLAAWDRARTAAGLSIARPPASLGEARMDFEPPQPKRADGTTDYFATSLPDLLLFTRG